MPRARSRKPRSADHDEQRPARGRADQPELLTDHREDEVGVRLRAGRTSSACSAPSPTPNTPPEPKAINDCTSWKPLPAGRSMGPGRPSRGAADRAPADA